VLRRGLVDGLLTAAVVAVYLVAVQAVAAGEAVHGAAGARRIVEFFTGAQQRYAAQVFPELTTREREVLDLVAAGAATTRSPGGWCCRRRPSATTSPPSCSSWGLRPGKGRGQGPRRRPRQQLQAAVRSSQQLRPHEPPENLIGRGWMGWDDPASRARLESDRAFPRALAC
jgi:hypothetical protein